MSPPKTIGQYQIAERLATGGAGEVYAGIDTKVGREVAIKVLRPELASDPSWVDRFLAEAKSLGRLNHPNIATLYTLDQKEDHLCMIMELVRGRTVEQIIEDRRGPLVTRESLAIIAQVADGLFYAHERGVIHRDIKPSNLMVTESGRVKILDFGIARVLGSARLTIPGAAIGTLLYMSPEQWKGLEGDERSDIYSLAIVLYELLAGAPPFKGTNQVELMKGHCYTPPPLLIPRIAGVEPPLESAIMTALSKKPEQRFPSMRSFSDATGATALRGDATGIIKNQARLAQGQAAGHEPPKRAPFHTVVVALMRSRAATIARRFRGLHPAVQGVSVVGVFAMVIAAAFLLRPESGPIDDGSKPIQVSLNGDQDGKQRQVPATSAPAHNDPISLPPNKAQTQAASGKGPTALPRNGGFPLDYVPSDTPDRINEQQIKAVEQNPPPRIEASKNQEGNKVTPDPANVLEEARRLLRSDSTTDVVQAKNLIYSLADGGYAPAMTKLGLIKLSGKRVKKTDEDQAATWFKLAAAKGDGEAMYNLSEMCKYGKGGMLPKDAPHWCQSAVDAGYPLAKPCPEAIDEKVRD